MDNTRGCTNTNKKNGRRKGAAQGQNKPNAQNHSCNTRKIVLDMLLIMEQGQEYGNRLIKGTLDKYDYLSMQDKAFLKRLFEGCVERRISLDYVINLFSGTKTACLKPVILEVLRMGVYQILYMDTVPDSAACNEAVKLIEKRGFSGLKGFVNGVLRAISREKEHISWPDPEKDPAYALSVMYAMPQWIVELFIQEHGFSVTETILKAFLQELPVTLRMDENLTEEEREKWIQSVKETGVAIKQHPYLNYAFQCYHVPGVSKLPGFSEGVWNVQDVSSMLVSEIAQIQEHMTILDVCAAPGGKSLHAACKLKGTGLVSARDLTDTKTALIRENAQRGQYRNLEILTWDALEIREQDLERADIVYVDAPCSGLGIMGKKCDIRYHVTKQQMQEIILLQRRILDTVSRYVKKGGVLIYSTCTIHKEENEDQIRYLQEKGFCTESMDAFLPECFRSETTAAGYLQLLPGIHETDGFFMARLRRL